MGLRVDRWRASSAAIFVLLLALARSSAAAEREGDTTRTELNGAAYSWKGLTDVVLPEPLRERPLDIEGILGAGTPVGLAGAALVLWANRFFGVVYGAGAGAQGFQVALGGRVRVTPYRKIRDRAALSFGVGWSHGDVEVPDIDQLSPFYGMGHTGRRDESTRWESAHMLNLEVAPFEHHFGSVYLRPFAGLGVVVHGKTAGVGDSGFPFLGAALGWAPF
jgi:hypothetical protein